MEPGFGRIAGGFGLMYLFEADILMVVMREISREAEKKKLCYKVVEIVLKVGR
jgi:hypothetical protein